MTRIRASVVGVLALALVGVATACMPPTPGGRSVTFKADRVTVNDSQDETCVLGICANRSDEPFVFNIAFRVKIGVPGSAQAYLVGDRDNAVNFGGITGLDVTDLLNPDNKLEVVGVYTWANEADQIPIGQAATGTASVCSA